MLGRLIVVWIVLLSLLQYEKVDGFANWMTKDYCRRSLKVGEVIMNEEVVLSSDRKIQVYREDQSEVSSGDVYSPGEIFTVRIDNTKGQYVYEVTTPAEFEDGGCENGNRIADEPEATMIMPMGLEASTTDINVVVAWATGHQQVKISQPFTLVPKSRLASASITTETKKADDVVAKPVDNIAADVNKAVPPAAAVQTASKDTPTVTKDTAAKIETNSNRVGEVVESMKKEALNQAITTKDRLAKENTRSGDVKKSSATMNSVMKEKQKKKMSDHDAEVARKNAKITAEDLKYHKNGNGKKKNLRQHPHNSDIGKSTDSRNTAYSAAMEAIRHMKNKLTKVVTGDTFSSEDGEEVVEYKQKSKKSKKTDPIKLSLKKDRVSRKQQEDTPDVQQEAEVTENEVAAVDAQDTGRESNGEELVASQEDEPEEEEEEDVETQAMKRRKYREEMRRKRRHERNMNFERYFFLLLGSVLAVVLMVIMYQCFVNRFKITKWMLKARGQRSGEE